MAPPIQNQTLVRLLAVTLVVGCFPMQAVPCHHSAHCFARSSNCSTLGHSDHGSVAHRCTSKPTRLMRLSNADTKSLRGSYCSHGHDEGHCNGRCPRCLSSPATPAQPAVTFQLTRSSVATHSVANGALRSIVLPAVGSRRNPHPLPLRLRLSCSSPLVLQV